MTSPINPLDTDALMTAYLIRTSPLTALCGARIWAGVDPPPGYAPASTPGKPLTGPALLFICRGGRGEIYNGTQLETMMQCQCVAATESQARAINLALFPLMRYAPRSSPLIKSAVLTTPGQPTTTKEGWPMVFVTYRLQTALILP